MLLKNNWYLCSISAFCRLQKHTNSRQVKAGNGLLPLTLICDNIRDPGMLGTLIRSAVAACCRTVLITKGKVISLYLFISTLIIKFAYIQCIHITEMAVSETCLILLLQSMVYGIVTLSLYFYASDILISIVRVTEHVKALAPVAYHRCNSAATKYCDKILRVTCSTSRVINISETASHM